MEGWADDDLITYLEDVEKHTGRTPKSLDKYRSSPKVDNRYEYIFDAIRRLFEERTTPSYVPLSTLRDYAEVYPVHDLNFFVTVFRRVDRSIRKYLTEKGN